MLDLLTLLKIIFNTDCVFMTISDIYFSLLIIMKFTDLFNLNNNPKFWIFQLDYSTGVFQKAQLYLSIFQNYCSWALTSFLEKRSQDQTLRARIPRTRWKHMASRAANQYKLHVVWNYQRSSGKKKIWRERFTPKQPNQLVVKWRTRFLILLT